VLFGEYGVSCMAPKGLSLAGRANSQLPIIGLIGSCRHLRFEIDIRFP